MLRFLHGDQVSRVADSVAIGAVQRDLGQLRRGEYVGQRLVALGGSIPSVRRALAEAKEQSVALTSHMSRVVRD